MCIPSVEIEKKKKISCAVKKKTIKTIEKQEEKGKSAGQGNHLTASTLSGNDRPRSLHCLSTSSAWNTFKAN